MKLFFMLFAFVGAVLLSSAALMANPDMVPLLKYAPIDSVSQNPAGREQAGDLPPVGTPSVNGRSVVIISENFESYSEGQLPPGWFQS